MRRNQVAQLLATEYGGTTVGDTLARAFEYLDDDDVFVEFRDGTLAGDTITVYDRVTDVLADLASLIEELRRSEVISAAGGWEPSSAPDFLDLARDARAVADGRLYRHDTIRSRQETS